MFQGVLTTKDDIEQCVLRQRRESAFWSTCPKCNFFFFTRCRPLSESNANVDELYSCVVGPMEGSEVCLGLSALCIPSGISWK